eukprot:scaffold77177_cov56-Phaeocystis_antarctica.AAC.1
MEVEAHCLTHGQGVLLVVGCIVREFRARWNGSGVRNAVEVRCDFDITLVCHHKRQGLCHLLAAQVDEVCRKHEANAGSADVQIVGTQVRMGASHSTAG